MCVFFPDLDRCNQAVPPAVAATAAATAAPPPPISRTEHAQSETTNII